MYNEILFEELKKEYEIARKQIREINVEGRKLNQEIYQMKRVSDVLEKKMVAIETLKNLFETTSELKLNNKDICSCDFLILYDKYVCENKLKEIEGDFNVKHHCVSCDYNKVRTTKKGE